MITGIIAEFNPFHNGHKYIIEQARKKTKCDYLVVAMSGDFVQRGAPAIIDKALRTKAALMNGADLVLQLPVIASTATAEEFALCGVKALYEAGTNIIAFGCETDNITILDLLSDLFLEEPEDYKTLLKESLKSGLSFPLARSTAVADFFKEHPDYLILGKKTIFEKNRIKLDELCEVLDGPNNILAIEYLKAIKRLDLPMDICPIKRIGVGHHSHFGVDKYTSASALRKAIMKIDLTHIEENSNKNLNTFFEGINSFLPSEVASLFLTDLTVHAPLCEDDLSMLIKYELLNRKNDGIAEYIDGNQELSNRIMNHLDEFTSFSQFAAAMNTKESTYARISRLLLHVLLHLEQSDMDILKTNPAPYLRILGFRKDSSAIIGMLKVHSSVPIVTSVKDAERSLFDFALTILKQDIYARDLYRSICQEKHEATMQLHSDYTEPLIII